MPDSGTVPYDSGVEAAEAEPAAGREPAAVMGPGPAEDAEAEPAAVEEAEPAGSESDTAFCRTAYS